MDANTMNMNPEIIKEQARNVLSKANEVPGFDPATLLSQFGDSETGHYNYLKAAPRLAWFRLAHPEGRTVLINHDVNTEHSFVEAQVFFDKRDISFVANGFAWMDRGESQAGQNHLKSAQTNALCIALGNAGFGTPVHARFNPDICIYSQTEDISEVPLDMGAPEPAPVKPPAAEKKQTRRTRGKGNLDDAKPVSPEDAVKEQSPDGVPAGTSKKDGEPADGPVTAGEADTSTIDSGSSAAGAAADAEPASDAPEAQTVEPAGAVELKTLDEAMAVMIRTGTHRDKTFKQLSEEVPNFKRVIDFYANPIGDTVPEDIRAAAEFIRIHKFGGE